jgi:hypothetical protein
LYAVSGLPPSAGAHQDSATERSPARAGDGRERQRGDRRAAEDDRRRRKHHPFAKKRRDAEQRDSRVQRDKGSTWRHGFSQAICTLCQSGRADRLRRRAAVRPATLR